MQARALSTVCHGERRRGGRTRAPALLAVLAVAACAHTEHADVANRSTTREPPPIAVTRPCAKLAAKLAPIPGEKNGGGGPSGREHALARMCSQRQWPARVTDCVLTADHDPLSCLGYLEGEAKAEWSTTFDAWYLN